MGQNYCSKNKVTKGRNYKTNQQKPSSDNKKLSKKWPSLPISMLMDTSFTVQMGSDTLLKNKTNEYNKTETGSQRTS